MDESSATSSAGRRGRRRSHAPVALGAAGVLALLLSFAGGTLAMWVHSTTIGPESISAGNALLTAAWMPGHDDAPWSDLLPGESVRRGFTLDNTGDVALDVTSSLAAAAPSDTGSFEVRVAAAPCGADLLAGDPVDTMPGALVTLGASQSLDGCVEVRLAGSATPGDTLAFALRFDGTQIEVP